MKNFNEQKCKYRVFISEEFNDGGKCLSMKKAGHRVAHKNGPIFHEKYLQNN